MNQNSASQNPYIGPRTFSRLEANRLFGRDIEGQNLKRLVTVEEAVIVHGVSGSGKSSLINAYVVPALEQEGFQVLPVARVSGMLPSGINGTKNGFIFNIMMSLDQQNSDPAPFAQMELTHFLERLRVDDDGRYTFSGSDEPQMPDSKLKDGESRSKVLIIDQGEEIFSQVDLWQYSEDFFKQLRDAVVQDPFLTVVLVIRSDYLAELDVYARMFPSRLRARQTVERLGPEAALEAIQRPAELWGRPFDEDAARMLMDSLRATRVPGRDDIVLARYVEPVQLQIACRQLWENLRGSDLHQITSDDVAAVSDVDRALSDFYEDAVAVACSVTDVSERRIRSWFSTELITKAGTRGTVYRDSQTGETGGLSNKVVNVLESQRLVRVEMRGGGSWVELVADRFVEPILASNAAWLDKSQSALQRQAAHWRDQGRPAGLLLQGEALAEAEAWAEKREEELEPHEQEFLAACWEARLKADLAEAQREARQNRRIRNLLFAAIMIGLMAFAAAGYAFIQTLKARDAQTLAEGRLAQFGEAVGGLGAERLMTLTEDLYEAGDIKGAKTLLQAAVENNAELSAELWAVGVSSSAQSLLQSIAKLEDANDGTYVYIPAGEFVMGDDFAFSNEKPSHTVDLDAYWIMQIEVTNAQYQRCVDEGVCEAPDNNDWDNPDNAQRPVTDVSWFDADTYAKWVGGRLPTEAEWEKACRSTDGRIYPWGDEPPSEALLNYYNSNVGSTTDVGSYPPGANHLYDMAGNVWEWTADWYDDGYYTNLPERNPQGPESGDLRTLRGGAWDYDGFVVRCAYRFNVIPDFRSNYVGFRVVSPGAVGR